MTSYCISTPLLYLHTYFQAVIIRTKINKYYRVTGSFKIQISVTTKLQNSILFFLMIFNSSDFQNYNILSNMDRRLVKLCLPIFSRLFKSIMNDPFQKPPMGLLLITLRKKIFSYWASRILALVQVINSKINVSGF